MAFKRWIYRDGRPHLLAKILNRGWAMLHTWGIYPQRFVTLEVVGRKSGKVISFPLAMVALEGERYLVSMLGKEANWVQNVRAAGGRARLLHGAREQVVLKEIEAIKPTTRANQWRGRWCTGRDRHPPRENPGL